jgi:uncharacterized protein YukE
MNARTPTGPAVVAASEAPPIGGIAEIGKRLGILIMASHSARNLAGLLETLSGTGYGNANAANDDHQMKWWEQVGYLADVLERLASELHDNSADAENILLAVEQGRRAP